MYCPTVLYSVGFPFNVYSIFVVLCYSFPSSVTIFLSLCIIYLLSSSIFHLDTKKRLKNYDVNILLIVLLKD